ncbi:hypothetical protein [Nakamurella leprariae]|uniref:Uncharacterized protein n=1 Tax=Nakamurella leprariae TaxID=2803911 RepID=A0A938YHM0_9ACTN|nr:hypothetical protein [Nakamurella leprariae]MBM9467988.1 hypothetical protein [Nakamurella leprariae]
MPKLVCSNVASSEKAGVGSIGTASVVLSALRQARRDHQAARHDHSTSTDLDQPTEVVGDWRFLGLGYATAGDAVLAAHAYADHLAAQQLAREASPG